jgi:putative FmdB family regulatory protein
MPTYDYECSAGHRFEIFQKMSDEPVSECPECGAASERKISGGAGFLFKGDGFYITDYRSDDYKKKASAESGDSSKSSGESSSKSSGESSSKSSSSDASSKGGGDSSKPKSSSDS